MTRSPIYVAIDTPDIARAKEIASRVHNHVGGIKLGLEFFSAHGQAGVREMAALGMPIFLDLKLHDIPNTVAKAVQALNGLKPAILTVHAAGGLAMMEDAKAAAPVGTKVVAVTVLTLLAKQAGLDGVVCSAHEVKAARKIWRDGFFVVPGIRPADGKSHGDQKRVMTPREALDQGASILVIGRPITQAEDPDQAARAIEATL
jgi:orotidine-5'-phosphate decarboxylase